jgi:hypothetical protein
VSACTTCPAGTENPEPGAPSVASCTVPPRVTAVTAVQISNVNRDEVAVRISGAAVDATELPVVFFYTFAAPASALTAADIRDIGDTLSANKVVSPVPRTHVLFVVPRDARGILGPIFTVVPTDAVAPEITVAAAEQTRNVDIARVDARVTFAATERSAETRVVFLSRPTEPTLATLQRDGVSVANNTIVASVSRVNSLWLATADDHGIWSSIVEVHLEDNVDPALTFILANVTAFTGTTVRLALSFVADEPVTVFWIADTGSAVTASDVVMRGRNVTEATAIADFPSRSNVLLVPVDGDMHPGRIYNVSLHTAIQPTLSRVDLVETSDGVSSIMSVLITFETDDAFAEVYWRSEAPAGVSTLDTTLGERVRSGDTIRVTRGHTIILTVVNGRGVPVAPITVPVRPPASAAGKSAGIFEGTSLYGIIGGIAAFLLVAVLVVVTAVRRRRRAQRGELLPVGSKDVLGMSQASAFGSSPDDVPEMTVTRPDGTVVATTRTAKEGTTVTATTAWPTAISLAEVKHGYFITDPDVDFSEYSQSDMFETGAEPGGEGADDEEFVTGGTRGTRGTR